MAFSTEEEESLESIKRWWQESGKSLLIGVIVFAVGYLGWTQWQRMQTTDAAAASDLYEQLGSAVILAPGTSVPEDARATAARIVAELKDDYSNSVYALYGALFSARLAVEANDLGKAETELQWLLDNANTGFFNPSDSALVVTAQLRLARVLLAKDEAQRALDLLATVSPGSFEADYSEIRGDAYVALGMPTEAQASYESASQAGSTSENLQMKLDDLIGS